MEQIKIREARKTDIKNIANFQVKMAFESEGMSLAPETVSLGVRAIMEDPSKGTYYITLLEGEPIACLLITKEWSDWRNGWIWWIQSLYVIPEHRKKGVFLRMYNYLKGLIFSMDNVMGIRLYVDRHNYSAQKVYESIGMSGEHYTTYEWMK